MVRSFLGHEGFYRKFINDLSKIARPLTKLLEKDIPFGITQKCPVVLETLKEKLINAPIIIVPDWNYPFEFMCNGNDFAVGAIFP